MLHQQRNVRTYLLDGDNLRHGLCSDLGFSPNDRLENMKRAAHVAKLMADAGLVVLCAFVSPHQLHREKVKTIVTENSDISFFEIHVKANLATCERRDPKGLYLKARAGILRNFTGISAPYEEPSNPDLVLDSDSNPVICLAEQVFNYLEIYLLSAKA
jgi:adenylyl-sulfate kinase